MKIELKNIMPNPLRDYTHHHESIWGHEKEINLPAKVLVDAASGKGKSTFTHILYGIRTDYTGEVLIDGENINSFNLNKWVEIRKTKISVVFQDLQLFGKLSAWENLVIKNDLTNHKSINEIENWLDILGMLDKKNQLASTLSYGQQQRIAIIRSLLQPFDVLLLDEPFSHLDDENANKAFELINQEIKAQNAGIIITTLGNKHGEIYNQILKL